MEVVKGEVLNWRLVGTRTNIARRELLSAYQEK
jgi:hypothetical protein